jgi:adenine-specific DNA-methyltransferase
MRMGLDVDKVIQGDCLEVMRSLPDNSVDLILSDPPYFRTKRTEKWDNQWKNDDSSLSWIDQIAEQWARLLKPNGSLYCFASPRMSARVEVTIGWRFNVLNNIRWDKSDLPGGGRHKSACKEALRSYFPAHESIIFAEHFGADNSAKGEAGYEQKCDELRGFVFEPLRAYLDGERIRSGVKRSDMVDWFASNGFPKYVTDRHAFSQTQWELPTLENHEALRECLTTLGKEEIFLPRPYESLRQEYESLRQEYESLRRPFSVTSAVPYTDTWTYPTVQPYRGKHVCEKPAQMLEHIISASSKPGAIVLDSFAGSGSTLIAAQKLGRKFIGIELDPHWVNVATQALNLRPQPTLEQRITWLETKVTAIDKRTRKQVRVGQLNLFDEVG